MTIGTLFMVLVQCLVWVVLVGLLVYYILRRIEDKKKETFEDRDN